MVVFKVVADSARIVVGSHTFIGRGSQFDVLEDDKDPNRLYVYEGYADEAAFFSRLFRAENTRSVLELGCGGGNVAWFIKEDFVLTLTDISEAMLA